MARPGELAQVIAEMFDLEPATVRQQARVLRDAGHMAKEKGGRGVGSMSPRDATNLVLAAGGTSRVKYSTIPITQHGACKSQDGQWKFDFADLPELTRLGPDHTFADTLEALIRSAMAGAVDLQTGKLTAAATTRRGVDGQHLAVHVTIYEPMPKSEVEIGLYSRDPDGESIEPSQLIRYEPRHGMDGVFDPPFHFGSPGNLTHRHEFSERVLWEIATLLKI